MNNSKQMKELNTYLKMSNQFVEKWNSMERHESNAADFNRRGMTSEARSAQNAFKGLEKELDGPGTQEIYKLHKKGMKLRNEIRGINRQLTQIQNLQNEKTRKLGAVKNVVSAYATLYNGQKEILR